MIENLRGAAPGAAVGANTQAAGGRYRVLARPDLNLRAGPGTAFEILKTIPFGTEITVLDVMNSDQGRWALVDIDGDGGRDGMVLEAFIERV